MAVMMRHRRTIQRVNLSVTVLVTSLLLSACNQERTGHSATYLDAINAARAQAHDCGDTSFPAAPPLQWNAKLAAAAQEHSDDMARNAFMGHEGSDGSTSRERIENQGYQWRNRGENVAAGQPDTRAVVEDWLNSLGHCENIMNPKFTEMGMALSENNTTGYLQYWTLDLGSR